MSTDPDTQPFGVTGIARRLVMAGALDEISARAAMDAAREARRPLPAWLTAHNLVDPAAMAAAYSLEFGIPIFDPGAMDPQCTALRLVPEALVHRHAVLPLYRRGTRLYVGISDPGNTRALDEIKFHTNLTVEPILVAADVLKRSLRRWQALGENLDDVLGDGDGLNDLGETVASEYLLSAAEARVDANGDDTPIVRFVNKVLMDAIRRGASDIHFEPYELTYRVRLRIDGLLKQIVTVPVKLSARIAARLKVMAQLDIAEKRLPQDGRIKLTVSKTKQIDFRVSTLPTLFGEKVVLRLLDSGATRLGIDKLGYEPAQKRLFLDTVRKPYGMVLVTGPTGSGKTVSLYTALNILNQEDRNIATVEDPVEIRMPGINQVQMNLRRGMTFATALRSFLRQDPDVIMVGEIRDLETAQIAIKAAQTGHMVLSTLHTNDAPQTITRLMNMGVAPYDITSSITLVVAQRLARCLHDCKQPVRLPEHALLAEGFSVEEIRAGIALHQAVGCDECIEGYQGRTGIYQVMPMDDRMQAIVLAGGNALQIAEAAQQAGISDLRQSALLKVRNGITSLAEINRVTRD